MSSESGDIAAVIAADKATTGHEGLEPGPWAHEPSEESPTEFLTIRGPSGYDVAHYVDPADAEFIVTARNRWHAYIAAIEAVRDHCDLVDELQHVRGGHGTVDTHVVRGWINAVLAVPSTPTSEGEAV